jgi:predicted O-methyltransferase YrrM
MSAFLRDAALRIRYRLRRREVARLVDEAGRIPGWRLREEAFELVRVSFALPADAVIVEIGAFLGSGTVLLAGGRKLRGSGRVHCVDPFDASGDRYSAPFYKAIADAEKHPLRERFETNVSHLGLNPWIAVHQGTAESVARGWKRPVDLLLLDGDHSPAGARSAFDRWAPFLKPGGMIAMPNSSEREYEAEHDGQRRLVVEALTPPQFTGMYCVGTTTFGRRGAGS